MEIAVGTNRDCSVSSEMPRPSSETVMQDVYKRQVLGGLLGSKAHRVVSERAEKVLFVMLMMVIIGINVYNFVKFC